MPDDPVRPSAARPGGVERRGRWAARAASALDGCLDAAVPAGFSRLGFLARRAAAGWSPPPRVDGATVLVTGASSGIGRATALGLAAGGARLWLVGRDPARTRAAADEALGVGAAGAETVLADLGDPAEVEALATAVAEAGPLTAIVHAAGALSPVYGEAPDGTEATVATGVLGPYRLTWRLAPLLLAADRAAVVTVSSGGMYTQRFDVGRLVMTPEDYRGATAYARVKRAQVVLARAWARRWGPAVASCAMHPGWVDTPGLAAGLPGFRRLGPLLRRPDEGADTAVWLTAVALRRPEGTDLSGFWHDRRPRPEHRWPGPGPGPDGALQEERALWAWCRDRTGLG